MYPARWGGRGAGGEEGGRWKGGEGVYYLILISLGSAGCAHKALCVVRDSNRGKAA